MVEQWIAGTQVALVSLTDDVLAPELVRLVLDLVELPLGALLFAGAAFGGVPPPAGAIAPPAPLDALAVVGWLSIEQTAQTAKHAAAADLVINRL